MILKPDFCASYYHRVVQWVRKGGYKVLFVWSRPVYLWVCCVLAQNKFKELNVIIVHSYVLSIISVGFYRRDRASLNYSISILLV